MVCAWVRRCKAQPVVLAAEVDSPAAVRSIIGSCLTQVLGNASDIAHGESSPEHLHQLRVGLRRLRTALRELADLLPSAKPQWAEALTQVFARLGAARDIDALAQTLLPALRKAGASELKLPADDTAVPPEVVLREPATQVLWLELLACAAGSGTSVEPEPFTPRVQERLSAVAQAGAARCRAVRVDRRHRPPPAAQAHQAAALPV